MNSNKLPGWDEWLKWRNGKLWASFFKGRQQINEIWLEKQVDLFNFLKNIKLTDQKYHLNFQTSSTKHHEMQRKKTKPGICEWKINKCLKDRQTGLTKKVLFSQESKSSKWSRRGDEKWGKNIY